MSQEFGAPIRTLPGNRFRDFCHRALPLGTFAMVLLATAFLWNERLAANRIHPGPSLSRHPGETTNAPGTTVATPPAPVPPATSATEHERQSSAPS